MKTVWVLVTGEENARVLEKSLDGSLVDVAKIDARKRSANDDDNAVAKRPRGAPTTRTRAEPPPSPDAQRHHETQAFAEKVAQVLEDYRAQGRFDELHVVATARMVGYLRPEMAPRVKSAIVGVLDQDLVHESAAALAQRLFAPT